MTIEELVKVASAATPGEWSDGLGSVLSLSGTICQTWNKNEDDFKNAGANATHIATFSPQRVLALLDALGEARGALEFYAGNKDGAWEDHVCDSWSGQVHTFDWNGETQDKPWDVARAALQKIEERMV